MGDSDITSDNDVTFSELLADDGQSRPAKVDIDVHNDIMALPYSSGTTGAPKGVMISQRATIYNVKQFMYDITENNFFR